MSTASSVKSGSAKKKDKGKENDKEKFDCKYKNECEFQQCDILTSVDSDEPVYPPCKLRNSK